MILTKKKILKRLMQIRDANKQGNPSYATRRTMDLMRDVSNPDTHIIDSEPMVEEKDSVIEEKDNESEKDGKN